MKVWSLVVRCGSGQGFQKGIAWRWGVRKLWIEILLHISGSIWAITMRIGLGGTLKRFRTAIIR